MGSFLQVSQMIYDTVQHHFIHIATLETLSPIHAIPALIELLDERQAPSIVYPLVVQAPSRPDQASNPRPAAHTYPAR